jgi:hypothetical protein
MTGSSKHRPTHVERPPYSIHMAGGHLAIINNGRRKRVKKVLRF